MSPSALTSQPIASADPTPAASFFTRSPRRSFWKVKASSAPSRCMARATPQAIERLLATPVTRIRLPASSPTVLGGYPSPRTRSC